MNRILIEVSREDQIEIEKICTEKSISITEYFLRLHRQSLSPIQEEAEKPKKLRPKNNAPTLNKI